MGLQFESAKNQDTQEFNMMEKREEITNQLEKSQEIDALTSTINVNDMNSMVTFGNEVAQEIAKSSDVILNSMSIAQVNDSGELLTTLSKIMSKFDLDEIKEDGGKSFFGRILNNAKKEIERILDKYHTMGDEIDKIYVKLKQYEAEINSSNEKLENLFEANVKTYEQLVKYIVAGEQAVKEVDEYLIQKRAEYEKNQDNMIQFDIQTLENAKAILEQRVYDLKIAENIAMQSVPMIKSMEFSNINLTRKINSAFIITMPVFKQALSQAILLKRQKIQAEGMKALDDKTNEMLIKNAQNTALQTKLTTQLSSESSVKIETLEQTWQTIVNGIDETRKIQEDARKKREEDTIRLNKLKEDFKNQANK